MPTKSPKKDDPEQSKRFIETAKEIGVDESENAFDKAFKKVTVPQKALKKGDS